ncbi:MAG: hypothetical protein J7M18_00100, partial [Candidatus Eremiobacteraeota bacterium]|nr:hypothetical protein [Candidatus Eremiobacteraeota bacterium]
ILNMLNRVIKEPENLTRIGTIAAYILMVVFALTVIFLFWNPPLFIPFIAEDRFVENLEILFLFLAFDLFLLSYFMPGRKIETRWPLLIGATITGFLAMEELDWAQRLITRFMPFPTPEIFTIYGGDRISARSFLKSEVWFGKPGKTALHLLFVLWGIVIPMLGMIIPGLKKYLIRKNFPYPPFVAVISVITGVLLSSVIESFYLSRWSKNAYFCWEVADFYAYLALFLTSGAVYIKLKEIEKAEKPGRSTWGIYLVEGLVLAQALVFALTVTGPGMWPPPTGGRPFSRTDLAFYTVLGSYHLEMGQVDKAKAELEIPASHNWPDPFAYLNLARIYKKEKRYENAVSELKRALYACAGNVDLQLTVYREYLDIARKTGDNEKAEQIRKIISDIEGGLIKQD